MGFHYFLVVGFDVGLYLDVDIELLVYYIRGQLAKHVFKCNVFFKGRFHIQFEVGFADSDA